MRRMPLHLFRDTVKQQQFDAYGFTVFNLLNAEQVSCVREVFSAFESIHHRPQEKFRGTGWVDDPQVISTVDDTLRPLVAPFLEKHFQNYQTLGFGFLIKEPGRDSSVPPHQDWTYVDESRFCSMNVWIALEEMTIENGCLWVIPRSQRIGNFLRPSPSYPWPFRNISRFVERFKQPVPLKAGESVCFNNKLIHGSYPNNGSTYRLAAVTTVYPEEAQLLHYYVHDTTTYASATAYAIEKKTFLTIPRGKPPEKFLSQYQVPLSFPEYGKWKFSAELFRLRISDLLRGA